jgi:hypothetical protein
MLQAKIYLSTQVDADVSLPYASVSDQEHSMTPADRMRRDAEDRERGIHNVTYHSPWLGLVCTARFTWSDAEDYQVARIIEFVEELLTLEIDGVDLLPRFSDETADAICEELAAMHKGAR